MLKPFQLLVVAGAVTLACAPAIAQQKNSRNHNQQQSVTHGSDKDHGKSGAAWEFGDPLPHLDEQSLAAFTDGLEEFQSVEDIEGGLGPIFNNVSCVACHSSGAIGGASEEKVTRFGRVTNGAFDGLEALGGTVLHALAIDPAVQEVIPPQANVTALRMATPVFGLGLVDAIADETLTTLAKRRVPEGISGRVSTVIDVTTGDTRVGRFGWKAHQATALAFAGEAYQSEMGVTNRFFPTESAPNGNTELLAMYDTVPDLEDELDPATGLGDVDHLANFMRFLAPPPPLKKNAAALAGGKTFKKIDCAACHVPVLLTGPSPIAALANQPVRLFSDLLLHDMGTLGDGIAQADASMTEMRTAPLWGLRARTQFLHDGRAATPQEAIEAHDGEAANAREQFVALSRQEQQQLLEYLNSN